MFQPGVCDGLIMTPRLGVVFRPQTAPDRLPGIARRAEQAGVAELWLWEDCFLDGAMATSTLALASTERLTVGVGLLPVPLRNAALTAMELSAAARVFPGRFTPALGHGVLEWMAQVGRKVASPMTLLREHTEAIRALLAGTSVTTSGRYVSLDAVQLDRPPATPPPVLIGARGPKTLRLAGEVADGVNLDSGHTPASQREALAHVNEGRAGRGDHSFLVVTYAEIDTTTGSLTERIVDEAGALGEAGADVVVFVAGGDATDPDPLVDAIGAI
jgi:alkanesulfonate monooxygenase SsuD/methylene tetrahydromethanopterin reductase-like flavin-dependent oxidoreductase (luciferase family)